MVSYTLVWLTAASEMTDSPKTLWVFTMTTNHTLHCWVVSNYNLMVTCKLITLVMMLSSDGWNNTHKLHQLNKYCLMFVIQLGMNISLLRSKKKSCFSWFQMDVNPQYKNVQFKIKLSWELDNCMISELRSIVVSIIVESLLCNPNYWWSAFMLAWHDIEKTLSMPM